MHSGLSRGLGRPYSASGAVGREAALTRARGDASALAHFTADAALTIDRHLRILAWNSAAEALLGHPEADVLGRPCYEVVGATTPSGEAVCSPHCAAASQFRACRSFNAARVLCHRRDGSRAQLSMSSMALPEAMTSDGTMAMVLLRSASQPAHSTPKETRFRAYAMGRFRLYRGEQELPWHTWPRKQAATLFWYLLTLRGRPVHREALCEALWPQAQPSEGLTRLKVVLHCLRRGLGDQAMERGLLLRQGENYLLAPDRLWVDAEEFEALLGEGAQKERLGLVQQALGCYQRAEALYGGDYLAELPYAEWAEAERQRLQELFLGLMERMASLHGRLGDYERAIRACRRGLALDRCRESLHRALMGHLIAAGRPQEAASQYLRCRQVLARELGIEPLVETTALYQSIIRGARVG